MKQFSLATIPLLCAAIAPLCADNVDNLISQTGNGNGNNQSQMSGSGMNNQKRKMEAQKQFEQRWRDNQITPEARPDTEGQSWNPIITADFIYWKAYSEGLAYAYNGVANAPSAVPPSASSGKVMRPKFDWEPGFKVGFGNKFAHDGWDLYAQYTWLNADADDDEEETECCETTCAAAKSMYWLATNACPEAVLVACEGAKWKLNSFNILDLELGRDFYISKFLTMRPFGGLKFSWQKQKYNVAYDDVLYVGDSGGTALEDSNDVIPVGSDISLKFKQKEFGVGLRVGMDTAWYFCKWLGAYGDFALTGLWNHFKETRTVGIDTGFGSSSSSSSSSSSGPSTGYNSENIKDKVYDVTGVLEIGLGLFFDWSWHNDDYMFTLAAGWETQVWFNQNNFIYLMNNDAPGNLSFQGFTLEAGFGF